jgi:hypothetical protein
MGLLNSLFAGLGSQGGMLSRMGLGQFGANGRQGPMQPGHTWMPPMASQMGQSSSTNNFLSKLGGALGGGQGGGADGGQGGPQQGGGTPLPAMPNLLPGGQQGSSPGLAELIAAYMKNNQRQ